MSARRRSSRSFGSITTLNGVAAGSGLARLCLRRAGDSFAIIWKSPLCSAMSILLIVDLITDRPSLFALNFWRVSALSAPQYLGHDGACPSKLEDDLKENRNDQDRNDVHNFDHRID